MGRHVQPVGHSVLLFYRRHRCVLLTAVIADKVIKSIRLVFWYPLIASSCSSS